MAELYAQIACAMPRELAAKLLGWQDRAVYTEAIYYGRENLTDGVIDRGTLAFWMPDMATRERVRRLNALRDRGALLDHPDGWVFPDHVWRKWGKTRAQVDEAREKEAERKKEYRDKKRAATEASEDVPTGQAVPATSPRRPVPTSHSNSNNHSNNQSQSHNKSSSADENLRPALRVVEDDDDRIHQAIQIHATVEANRKAQPEGRSGYRITTAANDMVEHIDRLRAELAGGPFHDGESLARAVFGITTNDIAIYGDAS